MGDEVGFLGEDAVGRWGVTELDKTECLPLRCLAPQQRDKLGPWLDTC